MQQLLPHTPAGYSTELLDPAGYRWIPPSEATAAIPPMPIGQCENPCFGAARVLNVVSVTSGNSTSQSQSRQNGKKVSDTRSVGPYFLQ